MSYRVVLQGKEDNYKVLGVVELVGPTITMVESRRITSALGFNNWWWKRITQAEYETYQVFGIKEIKLPC